MQQSIQLSEVKKNPAVLAGFDYCYVTKRNKNIFVAVNPSLFDKFAGILDTPSISSTIGSIESNELRKILCDQAGLTYDEDRQMHISVLFSRYGEPSSAIIEWQGTPPRTKTFVSLDEKPMVRFIGDRNIQQYSPRSFLLGELCFNFLNHHGFLGKK